MALLKRSRLRAARECLDVLSRPHKRPRMTPLSLRAQESLHGRCSEEPTCDDDDVTNNSLTASQGSPLPRLIESSTATQQWFVRPPLLEQDLYARAAVANLWEKGAALHFQASIGGACRATYIPLYRSHVVRAAWFTFHSAIIYMLDTLTVSGESVRMCESAFFKGIAAFDIAMSSPRGHTFMREGYGAFAGPQTFALNYDWPWAPPDPLPPARSAKRLRYQRRMLQLLMGGVLHGSRMDLLDDIYDSTLAAVVTTPAYAAQFAGVQDALEPVTHRHTAFERTRHNTRSGRGYTEATTRETTRTPAWFAADYVMAPSVSGNVPTLWDFTSTLLCSYGLAVDGTELIWKRTNETIAAHLMAQHSYAFPLWLAAVNVVAFAVDGVGIPEDKKPAWTACCEHMAQLEPETWARLRALRPYYRRTVGSLNLNHYCVGAT